MPGSILLGMLGRDGRIHNLRTPLRVDDGFIEAASRHGPPEARMRFAGACVTSGCAQWTGSRCGVIDRAMAGLADSNAMATDALPACTIRGDCRWFAQSGRAACSTCSLIVTDARPDTRTVAAE